MGFALDDDDGGRNAYRHWITWELLSTAVCKDFRVSVREVTAAFTSSLLEPLSPMADVRCRVGKAKAEHGGGDGAVGSCSK